MWMQKNDHFVRDFFQFLYFRHVIKQVGMSKSATSATQNNMTTCLETFETVRFSSFPIDTATPQENQRLATRHVDAEKPAFCARLPAIFTVGNTTKDKFCSFPHRHGEATGKPDTREETGGSTKTTISCETSSNFHTLQLQNRRFPTSFP